MNPNYTDITIVLDRSGSMSSVATDTIGGFNRFLEDQKKVSGACTLTLNQFDDQFDRVIAAKPIAEANPLTSETFVPRGNTALLDAIGRSIVETGQRLAAMPEDQRPGKVICVIITDGMENASKEYNTVRVNTLITEHREQWKWEFVFLGANQDAIKVGGAFGVPAANAMTYANNAQGVNATYGSLSRNLKSMRVGHSVTMDFSAEDRKIQREAGAK